jgi:hypothetical protein
MTSPNPHIRLATEADIASLLPLILTSFRQFPLFLYLHEPLNKNLDLAHDTLWLWERRLGIAIADPTTKIIIAEIDRVSGDVKNELPENREILEWLEGNGFQRREGDKEIIGFAIWEIRLGRDVVENERLGSVEPGAEAQEKCVLLIKKSR